MLWLASNAHMGDMSPISHQGRGRAGPKTMEGPAQIRGYPPVICWQCSAGSVNICSPSSRPCSAPPPPGLPTHLQRLPLSSTTCSFAWALPFLPALALLPVAVVLCILPLKQCPPIPGNTPSLPHCVGRLQLSYQLLSYTQKWCNVLHCMHDRSLL